MIRPRGEMIGWLALAFLPVLLGVELPSEPGPGIVYLGFLERGGANAMEANQQMPPFPRVRVVFRSERGDWRVIHEQPTDSASLHASPGWYPSPIHWNAVSDGRSMGELVSARPKDVESYGSIGLQVVVSSSLPPSVKVTDRQEAKYSVWPGMATFRPLVLVTSSFWKDPEDWQRFTPSRQSLDMAFNRLRKMLRAGVPVTLEESGDTKITSFTCRQHSLRLARAYRSKDGREVLSVELKGCAPPVASSIDYSIVYSVLQDAGNVTALGSDLWLVDAGDYDGDGSSEVVFGRSLHNHDSYVIFSKRFSKTCDFSWGYH